MFTAHRKPIIDWVLVIDLILFMTICVIDAHAEAPYAFELNGKRAIPQENAWVNNECVFIEDKKDPLNSKPVCIMRFDKDNANGISR